MISGMCRNTGKLLGELAHLKQSIIDILTTPIGSRIMLRNYGSRLFELVDQPINDRLKVQVYSATAEALNKWEPRFRCKKISIEVANPGKIELLLEGNYLPNGQQIKLNGIIVCSLSI
jgi:phage baseplate assembly protein W